MRLSSLADRHHHLGQIFRRHVRLWRVPQHGPAIPRIISGAIQIAFAEIQRHPHIQQRLQRAIAIGPTPRLWLIVTHAPRNIQLACVLQNARNHARHRFRYRKQQMRTVWIGVIGPPFHHQPPGFGDQQRIALAVAQKAAQITGKSNAIKMFFGNPTCGRARQRVCTRTADPCRGDHFARMGKSPAAVGRRAPICQRHRVAVKSVAVTKTLHARAFLSRDQREPGHTRSRALKFAPQWAICRQPVNLCPRRPRLTQNNRIRSPT